MTSRDSSPTTSPYRLEAEESSWVDPRTGEIFEQPEQPPTPDTADTYSQPQASNAQKALVSASNYLLLPREPATWLIEPLLPIGGSALLYGDPKVGKSFAALQLAAQAAAGEDWLGFHISMPRKVCYIQLDTPRSLWASRIEALLPTLPGLGQVLMADRETLQTWPFDILQPAHQKLLTEALRPEDLDLVIIDTLREAHSGDENDSTAMQAVVAHLTAAVRPAALVLVSHSRKSNPEHGYDLMNDNRGSNYIVGRMDAICRMSHTTIRVSGRAIDEQSVPLERLDNGLWGLANDPLASKADVLLARVDLSVREMAQMLHDESGKSVSACRAYLRRRQEKKEKAR